MKVFRSDVNSQLFASMQKPGSSYVWSVLYWSSGQSTKFTLTYLFGSSTSMTKAVLLISKSKKVSLTRHVALSLLMNSQLYLLSLYCINVLWKLDFKYNINIIQSTAWMAPAFCGTGGKANSNIKKTGRFSAFPASVGCIRLFNVNIVSH